MTEPNWVPREVAIDTPNVARMYDYFLGGGHNFAVDREAAERLIKMYPDLRLVAQANRSFLRRAVTYLVRTGVTQFIDIGSGIPTAGNVHQIAQRIEPTVRVVYVDIEPVAVAHSQALLGNVPNTLAVQGDARNVRQIVDQPAVRELLDWSKPIAVLLVALLHFVPDDDDALQIVRSLRDAVPAGSYVVITHATTEQIDEAGREKVEELYRGASSPFHFRSRDQIGRYFEGLDLVEPGLVHVPLWRPESKDDLFYDEPARSNGYVGVGRKP